MNGWKKKDKEWRDYPLGTKARESWGYGGYWIKEILGWRWCTGTATFSSPGAANEVLLPARPKYIVKDDLTLGYDIGNSMMGVLAAKIGGHDWKNGPVMTSFSTIRPATAEDFETFRVQIPPDFKGE